MRCSSCAWLAEAVGKPPFCATLLESEKFRQFQPCHWRSILKANYYSILFLFFWSDPSHSSTISRACFIQWSSCSPPAGTGRTPESVHIHIYALLSVEGFLLFSSTSPTALMVASGEHDWSRLTVSSCHLPFDHTEWVFQVPQQLQPPPVRTLPSSRILCFAQLGYPEEWLGCNADPFTACIIISVPCGRVTAFEQRGKTTIPEIRKSKSRSCCYPKP